MAQTSLGGFWSLRLRRCYFLQWLRDSHREKGGNWEGAALQHLCCFYWGLLVRFHLNQSVALEIVLCVVFFFFFFFFKVWRHRPTSRHNFLGIRFLLITQWVQVPRPGTHLQVQCILLRAGEGPALLTMALTFPVQKEGCICDALCTPFDLLPSGTQHPCVWA